MILGSFFGFFLFLVGRAEEEFHRFITKCYQVLQRICSDFYRVTKRVIKSTEDSLSLVSLNRSE